MTTYYQYKDCKNCKEQFKTKYEKQIYCCSQCREQFNLSPKTQTQPMPANVADKFLRSIPVPLKEKVENIYLNKSTIGAISELLVSADLLFKGYEVHRALSPDAGCDIVATKKAEVRRIEVRTGKYVDGHIEFSAKPNSPHITHFAVYNPKTKTISYIPYKDDEIK